MIDGNKLILEAVAVIALTAAVSFGIHQYNQHLVDKGVQQATAVYKPRAERAEAALEASEKERSRYEMEVKQLAGIARAAREQLDDVRARNDALVRAGEQLRQQLYAGFRRAEIVARGPAAGGGEAASPTSDLYADVQRRLDEATNRTIEFADESHIAGLACQRAYEVKGVTDNSGSP